MHDERILLNPFCDADSVRTSSILRFSRSGGIRAAFAKRLVEKSYDCHWFFWSVLVCAIVSIGLSFMSAKAATVLAEAAAAEEIAIAKQEPSKAWVLAKFNEYLDEEGALKYGGHDSAGIERIRNDIERLAGGSGNRDGLDSNGSHGPRE